MVAVAAAAAIERAVVCMVFGLGKAQLAKPDRRAARRGRKKMEHDQGSG